MREKKLKERAGVSPAIATILLILIAIAAGIIIYAYTVGYLGTSPGGKGAGELAIQAGELTDNAGTGDDVVTVYAKNVGGVDLNVTDVYVELTGGGPLEHLSGMEGDFTCNVAGTPTCKIAPGETVEIVSTAGAALGDSGAIVEARDATARVVCADGTADARSFRAHG